MPEVLLFGEDTGHAVVLQALVVRLASERTLKVDVQVRRARGGHGQMLKELRTFTREFQQCEKGRYKTLLAQAIRDAGVRPVVGGIEHAEDLVNAMNLSHVEKADASLGHFLKDLRAQLGQWEQSQ